MKWDETLYTPSTSKQGLVELTVRAMSAGAVAAVAAPAVSGGLDAPGTLRLPAIRQTVAAAQAHRIGRRVRCGRAGLCLHAKMGGVSLPLKESTSKIVLRNIIPSKFLHLLFSFHEVKKGTKDQTKKLNGQDVREDARRLLAVQADQAEGCQHGARGKGQHLGQKVVGQLVLHLLLGGACGGKAQ